MQDVLRSLVARVKAEPAVVSVLVGSVLVTVQEFGLDLSQAQENALQGLTAAVVALFIRSQVTPTSRL